jgi:fructan beta-fructosidase
MKNVLLFTVCLLCTSCLKSVISPYKVYHEPYRGQFHYSPKANWMNDPNGMVYSNGTFHLFYQYNPDAMVWGPMHWGHAISKDLIHWQEQPIALYPDNLGWIYSGSAVIDSNNTSGFGKDGQAPMVAIFTHHNVGVEMSGTNTFENQSIAYSLDEGRTWQKYANNPVLRNPGIKDFRDPKVMWYAPAKKWIMTLAASDHVAFYSSKNLKDWQQESDFGTVEGSHSGVWECPDLFTLKLNGRSYWILLASVNPGGPNGGSATQYFIGDFNGKTFKAIDNKIRWIDYGPDNYAGVTWNNTGDRRIFLAWMSNWTYSNVVPAITWRNAMTLPRELTLKLVNDEMLLCSAPVTELDGIKFDEKNITENTANAHIESLPKVFVLKVNFNSDQDFKITLSNRVNNYLVVGYDHNRNSYYIDRTQSGVVDFQAGFPGRLYVPKFSKDVNSNLTLFIDASSAELFADNNSSVMSCTFFTTVPYSQLSFNASDAKTIQNFSYASLNSIW